MTAPLHVKRSFSVLRWRLYYLVRLISKRLRKSECQESRYQHRRSMWVLNCCCFFHEQISAQSKGEKSYLSNFKFQHFSGGVARLGWGWQWQISTINWQWRGGDELVLLVTSLLEEYYSSYGGRSAVRESYCVPEQQERQVRLYREVLCRNPCWSLVTWFVIIWWMFHWLHFKFHQRNLVFITFNFSSLITLLILDRCHN